MRRWLRRLDRFAMGDPDNNEGHPEDRCSLCERPIVDHPCWAHRLMAWAVIVGGGHEIR